MAKAAVQQDEDKVLEIIEKTLDDNKAEDVVVIDLRGKTSIANQMVVASGTSQRHVASLAEKVKENLKRMLPEIGLTGQWSMDIMQNGNDFYLIDMALAENSALKECVPKSLLKKVEEDWIPRINTKED